MTSQFSRIAIVTGSSSGIGAAVARIFVASGYGVVGNGRNAEKLADLSRELGDAFISVVGDAANDPIQEALFETAISQFGKPADIIIANAGRGLGGSVKDADLAEFEEVVRTNLTGTVAFMQKAAQRLVEQQKESYPRTAADIVVIGSVSGRNVSPFSAVYGSTKFAIHAITEGLRREIGPQGVRVSLVEPGIVISGFQGIAGYSDNMVENFHEKFGPLLYGEDVANAIHFIVSQAPHVHIGDLLIRPTRQDYP